MNSAQGMGICTAIGKCDFHRDGGPADAKCQDYCSVGDCRDLVGCEEACDGDGGCHAHAAQWHAEQAGLPGFVTLPEDSATPRAVDPQALGQQVARVMQNEISMLADTVAGARAVEVAAAAGMLGASHEQVVVEIARLRRIADVATKASGIAATAFESQYAASGPLPGTSPIVRIYDLLREVRPAEYIGNT